MFEDDEIVSADPAYWIPSNYRDEPVHMAITADGSPVVPPASWFNNPSLTRPTALVIEQDGRVYGHIACWETKHIGMPGAIRPPRSKSNYAFFATGAVHTQEGHMVDVGQITLVGGHAPIDVDVPKAVAHYDDTQSAVCDVAIGEDRHGIWVAGALRPDVDDKQVRQLRASAVSGDWRPINGNLELVAVCSVNVPGFPIPRARVASGQTLALVAAGIELLVEDRLREYGDGTQHEIDEVLMAIATRVERLEAWMLAVVDPENMSSLEDDDKYGHGEYGDEHEHGEGCGCGMMSGGYGMKKKRGAMVSSKDIKMNADSIEKSTSIEDLRKRVRSPLMASLRSRVHGDNESVPFDRAAELRNRVHASTGVTAAVGKFDASLHPRGKDGKFIEKLGFVNFSVGRKQERGQVVGIGKGTGNNKGKTVLTIQKEDGSTVDMTSDKVSQASKSKADLSGKKTSKNKKDQNAERANTLIRNAKRYFGDMPASEWTEKDRYDSFVIAKELEELVFNPGSERDMLPDDLSQESISVTSDLYRKGDEYDRNNGIPPSYKETEEPSWYKNYAPEYQTEGTESPTSSNSGKLRRSVTDKKPFSRQDEIDEIWDREVGDTYGRSLSPEDQDKLIQLLEEKQNEVGLQGISDKEDLRQLKKVQSERGNAPSGTGVSGFSDDEISDLRDLQDDISEDADVSPQIIEIVADMEGLAVGESDDPADFREMADTLQQYADEIDVESLDTGMLDLAPVLRWWSDRFSEAAGGSEDNSAPDVDTPAGDGMKNTPSEARAFAAEQDKKQFSKQDEINAIFSKEKTDSFGRDLSPEDQDRLIELLEEKQAETGLAGLSDKEDLRRLKKWQSERGNAGQGDKKFSKQDQISRIYSTGRDLFGNEEDSLITLLEEKQTEVGLSTSESADLKEYKRRQTIRKSREDKRMSAIRAEREQERLAKEADLEVNLEDPTLPASTVSTIKALQKSADNMVSMADDFRRMGNPTLADETLASRDTTLKTAKWLSIVNSKEGSDRLARIAELESNFGNAYATDVVKNMTTSEERKELLDLVTEQNKIDATYNPLEAREARLAAIKEIVSQLDGSDGMTSSAGQSEQTESPYVGYLRQRVHQN